MRDKFALAIQRFTGGTKRMKRLSFPRSLVALTALLALIAGQGTWALAGVTGNIQGTVRDTSGAPVADVQVEAIAPSMSRSATTDAGGHFIVLSLAPDTYTINLTKAGYQSIAIPGVTVFADQTQSVAYTMTKTLKTI
ncbi:MAG TPA: carboxypeptidase-like regulatory domain-containing protein, partial [Candidatus Eremiobacteraceae bacterium]|nr:carboxypeptidase-like regulatory domain-containing protein [Candidatus Eremiobacteraceae bacterium]